MRCRQMLRDPHARAGFERRRRALLHHLRRELPYLLTHWTRDRTRGELSIPFVVAAQSRRTAELVGLMDRGVLARGYKADINVIDLRPVYTDSR